MKDEEQVSSFTRFTSMGGTARFVLVVNLYGEDDTNAPPRVCVDFFMDDFLTDDEEMARCTTNSIRK